VHGVQYAQCNRNYKHKSVRKSHKMKNKCLEKVRGWLSTKETQIEQLDKIMAPQFH